MNDMSYSEYHDIFSDSITALQNAIASGTVAQVCDLLAHINRLIDRHGFQVWARGGSVIRTCILEQAEYIELYSEILSDKAKNAPTDSLKKFIGPGLREIRATFDDLVVINN